MNRRAVDYRSLQRVLRRDPRVTVTPGTKHTKVFVDGRLVTVLPRSSRSGRDCDLLASVRELRKVGVIA